MWHLLSHNLTWWGLQMGSQHPKGVAFTIRIRVVKHLQYATFCLLVLMCFGDSLDENHIKEVECVQRPSLLSFGRYHFLNFLPKLKYWGLGLGLWVAGGDEVVRS
ncbi:hypothetical protein GBA52_016450 [Prunus armeniaca]|nr:hypothetical protein GBA52_016450 [Prunus armeniaca]